MSSWHGPMLTLAALFWAGNAVAAQVAVGEISPMMLTFMRWVGVIAVLWPLFGGEVRANFHAIRPRLPLIIPMAGLGFTGFNGFMYVAGHQTSAINIGILQGSMPVFVLAGAFLAYRTPVLPIQWAGALVTVAGVAVVATQGEPLKVLELSFNRGDLWMMVACALYSAYAVALRDRPRIPGAPFFTVLALIAAVTALPLVLIEGAIEGFQAPTLNGWLVCAYVAIFPSCIAQLLFMRGVDMIGPGRAGVYINLVPVFSAILAVALIGERFAPFHAASLALVLGGIWLAQRHDSATSSGGAR